MDRWVLYAVLSMLFAGVTAVLAKRGLEGVSGELGLTVRTVFVAGFVLVFAAVWVPVADVGKLTRSNVLWLAASALTTALSWGFYYKALELGEVATVAVIDKGSFVVAVLLAWLLLREPVSPRLWAATGLILAGLMLAVRRQPA
jgi:transporter family protein